MDDLAACTGDGVVGGKHLVRDEWTNEDVPFYSESDALLATLALSKGVDPSVVNKLFSLMRDPTIKPSVCTLHSVADVHSLASNYRRQLGNAINGDAYTLKVPLFVWEEVILHIGDQWVAYASQMFGRSVHEEHFWDGDIINFLLAGHPTLFDLRRASLVHRSWTRPAQRQMGRVLVLETAKETTLSAAIQSNIYGDWTQILALKGSSSRHAANYAWGGGEQRPTSSPDDFMPNRARLKSFVARFPFLATIFFDSTNPEHVLQFLYLVGASEALNSVTIVNRGLRINDSTTDVIASARRWPRLKNLNLVGFGMDLTVPNAIARFISSPENPAQSSLFTCISGGKFNLHGEALIHRISIEEETHSDGTMHANVHEVQFRRLRAGTPPVFPDVEAAYDLNVVLFNTLADQTCLSWLPKIERIHLTDIYESEAEDILRIAASVRHLSWSGSWFTPLCPLPAPLLGLRLFVPNAIDDRWHDRDRDLHRFLLHKRNPDLQHVAIVVQMHGFFSYDYPESETEFPYIYFPRSTKLCTTLEILFTVEL